jgi:hypothetical protein
VDTRPDGTHADQANAYGTGVHFPSPVAHLPPDATCPEDVARATNGARTAVAAR